VSHDEGVNEGCCWHWPALSACDLQVSINTAILQECICVTLTLDVSLAASCHQAQAQCFGAPQLCEQCMRLYLTCGCTCGSPVHCMDASGGRGGLPRSCAYSTHCAECTCVQCCRMPYCRGHIHAERSPMAATVLRQQHTPTRSSNSHITEQSHFKPWIYSLNG
jgi:hypothetical protein